MHCNVHRCDQGLLNKICDAANPLRPALPADMPPAFAALLRECWAPKPEDRPVAAVVQRRLSFMRYQLGSAK